jgi:hypothetical protein
MEKSAFEYKICAKVLINYPLNAKIYTRFQKGVAMNNLSKVFVTLSAEMPKHIQVNKVFFIV